MIVRMTIEGTEEEFEETLLNTESKMQNIPGQIRSIDREFSPGPSPQVKVSIEIEAVGKDAEYIVGHLDLDQNGGR